MLKIKYIAFFIIGILSFYKGNNFSSAEKWVKPAQAEENKKVLHEAFPEVVGTGCSGCGFGSQEIDAELT